MDWNDVRIDVRIGMNDRNDTVWSYIICLLNHDVEAKSSDIKSALESVKSVKADWKGTTHFNIKSISIFFLCDQNHPVLNFTTIIWEFQKFLKNRRNKKSTNFIRHDHFNNQFSLIIENFLK